MQWWRRQKACEPDAGFCLRYRDFSNPRPYDAAVLEMALKHTSWSIFTLLPFQGVRSRLP